MPSKIFNVSNRCSHCIVHQRRRNPFFKAIRGIEEVRHDMGRGDEVDIMAANLLEFEHHLRQFFIFIFLSSSFMGNRPILTEDTSKVTVGEEDSPGPVLTHQ
jgi:hypothetical protein